MTADQYRYEMLTHLNNFKRHEPKSCAQLARADSLLWHFSH